MASKDSFSCGFFNSIDHDRVYEATQMGELFDGLIRDGVYLNWGDEFSITASEIPNTVIIGTGRAWLNRIWCVNDSPIVFDELDPPSQINYRYDAIVIDIDFSDEVRNAEIKVIKGTEDRNGPQYATNPTIVVASPNSIVPQLPTLIKTNKHRQYPICYILRRPGVDLISQSDIVYMVRSSVLPSVTAIDMNMHADNLLAQWNSQMTDLMQWRNDYSRSVESWVSSLQTMLSGDVAGNLANEINNAKGLTPTISGDYTHTEGYQPTASANYAHAEGYQTVASGIASHAEGEKSVAKGKGSHAGGGGKALLDSSFVHGFVGFAGKSTTNIESNQTGSINCVNGAAFTMGKGSKAELNFLSDEVPNTPVSFYILFAAGTDAYVGKTPDIILIVGCHPNSGYSHRYWVAGSLSNNMTTLNNGYGTIKILAQDRDSQNGIIPIYSGVNTLQAVCHVIRIM